MRRYIFPSGFAIRGFVPAVLAALALASSPASGQSTAPWPTNGWLSAAPSEVGMDAAVLAEAQAYALTGGGSGIITRGGRLVMSWGSLTSRYDLKSSTKSIGTSAIGLAIADGRASLSDPGRQLLATFGVPPDYNSATGWLDDINLLKLGTHTGGFPKTGGYGSLGYAPGTTWSYSDGGFNWLADVMTQAFQEDLNALLFRRIFSPLGIGSADLVWRSTQSREDMLNGIKRREFSGGISANVDAMARIGYLYLRGGAWETGQILPASFVSTVRRPSPYALGLPVVDESNYPRASSHYGVGWYTNADGTIAGVPTDAYWSWGLYDSLIVVIPSLDIVAARAGSGLGRTGWNTNYSWVAPLIKPIVRSVTAVQVPDVSALSLPAARTAITAAGLVVGKVTKQRSSDVAIGDVISQTVQAGSSVVAGTSVSIAVSDGPAAGGVYLDFDGSDDRVTVANASALRLSKSVTVEAWIRPRTMANSTALDRVLRKGNNYDLTVSTGDTGCEPGTAGHVQWRAKIAGVNKRICGGLLSPDAWHHVTGTYSGASFDLYVDGVLVATMSRSGSLSVDSLPLVIGNHESASRAFDGGIDTVAVWKRALTSSEIRARMTSQLKGSETGLVAWWSFDEGTGQLIMDGSSKANHGVRGTGSEPDGADPAWQAGDAPPASNSVPDVLEYTRDGAAAVFADAGLALGAVATESSDVVPAGHVIRQSPLGGTMLPTGATVDVTISSGPP